MLSEKKHYLNKEFELKNYEKYELIQQEIKQKALDAKNMEQIRLEALERLRKQKELEAKLEEMRNRPKPPLPLTYFRHYSADKIDPVNLRQLAKAAKIYKVQDSMDHYDRIQWQKLDKLPCKNVLLETQLKTITDPKYLKMGVSNNLIGGLLIAQRNFKSGNTMQGIYGSTYTNGFLNRPYQFQV